ncbi:MAG: DUF1232 domain-containing protein [Firmicutes bacterium]|jgi:uncharacterized membrane protein YkvA (DUF1232 family)|nr:DUF1232 domain-containing protein [Bacillota bacterium]
MQFWSFRVILSRFKAIRFMMADKTVPKTKKALIIAGIAYLFLPFDLIPAMVFPLSLIDDLVVWLLIIWYLKKELDVYWTGEKKYDLSKKYRSKDIVDDVEFEVEEDKAEAKAEAKAEEKGNE